MAEQHNPNQPKVTELYQGGQPAWPVEKAADQPAWPTFPDSEKPEPKPAHEPSVVYSARRFSGGSDTPIVERSKGAQADADKGGHGGPQEVKPAWHVDRSGPNAWQPPSATHVPETADSNTQSEAMADYIAAERRYQKSLEDEPEAAEDRRPLLPPLGELSDHDRGNLIDVDVDYVDDRTLLGYSDSELSTTSPQFAEEVRKKRTELGQELGLQADLNTTDWRTMKPNELAELLHDHPDLAKYVPFQALSRDTYDKFADIQDANRPQTEYRPASDESESEITQIVMEPSEVATLNSMFGEEQKPQPRRGRGWGLGRRTKRKGIKDTKTGRTINTGAMVTVGAGLNAADKAGKRVEKMTRGQKIRRTAAVIGGALLMAVIAKASGVPEGGGGQIANTAGDTLQPGGYGVNGGESTSTHLADMHNAAAQLTPDQAPVEQPTKAGHSSDYGRTASTYNPDAIDQKSQGGGMSTQEPTPDTTTGAGQSGQGHNDMPDGRATTHDQAPDVQDQQGQLPDALVQSELPRELPKGSNPWKYSHDLLASLGEKADAGQTAAVKNWMMQQEIGGIRYTERTASLIPVGAEMPRPTVAQLREILASVKK